MWRLSWIFVMGVSCEQLTKQTAAPPYETTSVQEGLLTRRERCEKNQGFWSEAEDRCQSLEEKNQSLCPLGGNRVWDGDKCVSGKTEKNFYRLCLDGNDDLIVFLKDQKSCQETWDNMKNLEVLDLSTDYSPHLPQSLKIACLKSLPLKKLSLLGRKIEDPESLKQFPALKEVIFSSGESPCEKNDASFLQEAFCQTK